MTSTGFTVPDISEFPVPLNIYDTAQAAFRSLKVDGPASLPVPNSTRSFWLHPSKDVNPLAKEVSSGSLANADTQPSRHIQPMVSLSQA